MRPGRALGERDREILDFERQWWKYAGAKETAVREKFDMSSTRYYQVLNALIDRPEALAADPLLVRRLRRLRADAAARSAPRAASASRSEDGGARRDQRGVVFPSPVLDPEHRRGGDGRGRLGRHPAHGARRAARRRPAPSRARAPHHSTYHPPKPRHTDAGQAHGRPVQGRRRGLQQLRRHRASPAPSPARATNAGWKVVGSDNWYGTIPATTVYYPPKLERGRPRSWPSTSASTARSPAVAPMRLDRLTVILTGRSRRD